MGLLCDGFVPLLAVVREVKGPYNDPQHPYMYEEEDMWMAPGFINEFHKVPEFRFLSCLSMFSLFYINQRKLLPAGPKALGEVCARSGPGKADVAELVHQIAVENTYACGT